MQVSKPRYVAEGATGGFSSETGGSAETEPIGPRAEKVENLDYLPVSATLGAAAPAETGPASDATGATGATGSATGATGATGSAAPNVAPGQSLVKKSGSGSADQGSGGSMTTEERAVEADPDVKALEAKLAAAKKAKAALFEENHKDSKTLAAAKAKAAEITQSKVDPKTSIVAGRSESEQVMEEAKAADYKTKAKQDAAMEKKMRDQFNVEDAKLQKLAKEQISAAKAAGGDTKAMEAEAKVVEAENKKEFLKEVDALKKKNDA